MVVNGYIWNDYIKRCHCFIFIVLSFLCSSGRGKHRRELDAGAGDGSWGKQRYRDFDDRSTRGKSRFTESSNPFFPEQRKSSFPKDPSNKRRVESSMPHRSLFHELSSPDRDNRGMGKWGKHRGHKSSPQNRGFEEWRERSEDDFDFMDEEFLDDK